MRRWSDWPGKLGVENVTPNYQRQAAKVPNDPNYGQQWQWPQIKAPDAWNYSTGSSSVVVAVLDTGVDLTHTRLAGQPVEKPRRDRGQPHRRRRQRLY
jgi:subtilisin family serine protease